MHKLTSPALLLFSILLVSSCKKESIELTDVKGIWIEETENSQKVELELLENGTLYTYYYDTTNTQVVDTGSFSLNSSDNSIQFEFDWASRQGTLNSKTSQLVIPNFREDIFPTETKFNRK